MSKGSLAVIVAAVAGSAGILFGHMLWGQKPPEPGVHAAVSEAYWHWDACRSEGWPLYGMAIQYEGADPQWAEEYRNEMLARQVLEAQLVASGLLADSARSNCPASEVSEAKRDSLHALVH